MSNGINGNYNNHNTYEYDINKVRSNFEDTNIDLEAISILYSTEKLEDNRTTFDETFDSIDANDESTDGAKFLDGLIENKETLQKDLGLSDEEYDNLACIALALASQETGMGEEEGYKEENKGLGGVLRKAAKWIDSNIFGNGSASSGLTQMKIYDFMNSETSPLSNEQKELLSKYGIEANGTATNNLFDNPDKAAIASMIVLTNIYENYDEYKNVLSTSHSNLETELGLTTDEAKNEAEVKGEKILYDITSLYNGITNTEEKVEMREAVKSWLMASNGTKEGDKDVKDEYNEELCLNNLNKLLEEHSAGFKLTAEDLNFIRYELTTEASALNPQEYCAYGWNKGTGTTVMQLDRLLSDTIGTILKNPEDFDYDQFTVNVSTLAQKYIQQSA